MSQVCVETQILFQNPYEGPMSLQLQVMAIAGAFEYLTFQHWRYRNGKMEKVGVLVGMDGGPTQLWWVYVHRYVYIIFIYTKEELYFFDFQLPTKLIRFHDKKWVPYSADRIFFREFCNFDFIPIGSIRGIFFYLLHLPQKSTKCRKIYHTCIQWDKQTTNQNCSVDMVCCGEMIEAYFLWLCFFFFAAQQLNALSWFFKVHQIE